MAYSIKTTTIIYVYFDLNWSFRPYGCSNTFNLIENSKIFIYLIFCCIDISMSYMTLFNSHMHIALNRVVFIQTKLAPHITRPSLIDLELCCKRWFLSVSYSVRYL